LPDQRKEKENGMKKIKVLDKEIEVPEEIYYLLKKEADDEFQLDFQSYIDVSLGLPWAKYLEDTDREFTAEDILKIEARRLAYRYWLVLELRDDDLCFHKDSEARVDAEGHISTAGFRLRHLRDGFHAIKGDPEKLETLLLEFESMDLPKVDTEVEEFLREMANEIHDKELEWFMEKHPFNICETFFFLAGLHAGKNWKMENM
jgi:hypothetical protein